MNIHRLICETFNTSARRDNMPKLLRRGNRERLADVFIGAGFVTGAEIGTRAGAYAKHLVDSVPGLHLFCIDPWKQYKGVNQSKQDRLYAQARRILNGRRVTIIRQTSMEAVTSFENSSIDFVYIDGDHTFDFVMKDILFWTPKVRSGGIIALHDYKQGYWSGVIPAVDAYTRCHDIRPVYVTKEEYPTVFWVQP